MVVAVTQQRLAALVTGTLCSCLIILGSKFSENSRETLGKRSNNLDTLDPNITRTSSANLIIENQCNIRPLKSIKQFFNYIYRTSFLCQNVTHYGGSLEKQPLGLGKFRDGDKAVCTDDNFPFPDGECTVYSFGINEEWSFDEAMANKGCQVHSFDPTMDDGDHLHSPGVHFHHLGIGAYKGMVSFEGENKKYPVDTLRNIMSTLGHKKLYYLKMDVEGSEIPVFQDIFGNHPKLLENIQQIGIEIHPGKYTGSLSGKKSLPFHALWQIFQQLECFGFRLLHSEPNRFWLNTYNYNGKKSACYELLWGRPDTRLNKSSIDHAL